MSTVTVIESEVQKMKDMKMSDQVISQLLGLKESTVKTVRDLINFKTNWRQYARKIFLMYYTLPSDAKRKFANELINIAEKFGKVYDVVNHDHNVLYNIMQVITNEQFYESIEQLITKINELEEIISVKNITSTVLQSQISLLQNVSYFVQKYEQLYNPAMHEEIYPSYLHAFKRKCVSNKIERQELNNLMAWLQFEPCEVHVSNESYRSYDEPDKVVFHHEDAVGEITFHNMINA